MSQRNLQSDRKPPRETSVFQPNLYLIGFMGVGKSVVGRSVARMMKMQFMDSDWVIERNEGKPISKVFEESGEAAFRQMERAFVESGHPVDGTVVSCGGGLPLQPGIPEILRKRGVVICLFAGVETILARTMGNSRRPLLNVEDPQARVKELLTEREPLYMQTGIGISAEGRTITEVVRNVVRVYRREAKHFRMKAPSSPTVPGEQTKH